MKLRIESDGTPHGTHLYTEDGQRVERVTRIEWTITATNKAQATVRFEQMPVRVLGEAHGRRRDDSGAPPE